MSATTSFLRKVILADAAASGAMGLLLLAAAGPLAPLLGVPAALMQPVGAFLLLWSGALVLLLRRATLPAGAVWLVAAINAAWVIDSVLVMVLGWLQPTPLGVAFILAQAAVVAMFALLQARGARALPLADPRRQVSPA